MIIQAIDLIIQTTSANVWIWNDLGFSSGQNIFTVIIILDEQVIYTAKNYYSKTATHYETFVKYL